MALKRVVTPSLPCPYCGGAFSTHLPDARFLDGQGADPERTVLELHVPECDRRDDPVATGFVEASELEAWTNESLGLSDGSDSESKTSGGLRPVTTEDN